MEKNKIRDLAKGIRLVVCDMDGTLLNSQKELSAASLEAVRALKQRGVAFTICSGRISTMLGLYLRQLEPTAPIISCNGAVVSDPATGEVLRQTPIPEDQAMEFMAFCRARRFEHAALTPDGCWFSPGSACLDRFIRYNRVARGEGLPQIPLFLMGDGPRVESPGKRIHKMLLCSTAPGQIEEAARFVAERLPGVSGTSSDPVLLDLSAKGVDKGRGLRDLLEVLGLTPGEVCVFGDYYNDLPMLRLAGLPVAMGNACPEAREAALWVAAGNDEDGVARALWELIL